MLPKYNQRKIAKLLGYPNHIALNTYINKRNLREGIRVKIYLVQADIDRRKLKDYNIRAYSSLPSGVFYGKKL